MFKNLFGGGIEICRPGTDDPICQCQFNGSFEYSNHPSILTPSEDKSKTLWQKVRQVVPFLPGR